MATHAALVTPQRVLYEGEAEFVVLRSEGGEIMFLPNHAPFVGAVDITVLRVALAGGEAGSSGPPDGGAHGSGAREVRAAVHGGFVHVADNRVLVLASVAELAEEIDVARARRALEVAESALAGREESSAGHVAAGQEGASARDGAAVPGGAEGVVQGVEESPTMLALLHPDAPEVAARRARARLEVAGALEPSSSATA